MVSFFQEKSTLIDVIPLVKFILFVNALAGTLVMMPSSAPTLSRGWGQVPFSVIVMFSIQYTV